MKRIIISSICGLLALTLVGCSSASEDTAIKNLSNQLDRVTNTVSSISDKQYDSILPQAQNYLNDSTRNTQYATPPVSNNSNWYIESQISQVQNGAYAQSSLKQALLSQSATLKASLSSHVKLNKSQIKALNGLTNSISKYVTSLNNTKSDIANSIKQVKKISNPNENIEQTGAFLQSLNNHMDARMCYFRNLLNSINEAERIVLGNCNNCNFNDIQPNQNPQGNTINNYYDYSNRYIDSHTNHPVSKADKEKLAAEKDKEQKGKNLKNIDTYRNTPINQENTNTPTPAYQQTPAVKPGYNNGYYGGRYGYNNGYYNRYNNGFNPNRNTDTYLPGITNIDTYRTLPNGGYYNNGYYNNGYNNMPAYNYPAMPVNKINTEKVNSEIEIQKPTVEEDKSEDIKAETPKKNKVINIKELPKTQEVNHYQSTFNIKKDNSLCLGFDTNKKIEKLIKG